MNNPFKLIFIIFNLLPSIAPDNYSVPLPETELKMGQNASQIVERDGAITLVGGTRVTEVFSDKRGPQQKELTLSFPVVRKLDGKKGFLVPFSLNGENYFNGGNYFVDDTKIGGGEHTLSPAGLFSSGGIAYAFLDIYPEFWSDKNSPNVLYNDCDKAGCKTVLIPLLPTPNQNQLPLKTNVCAYGGASGYVCGEIVDFDATITSYGLKFHPVTKVSMNKPCLEGDEGAPVYIPTNVPNSKQMVANAVGQVIRDEKASEINMWYYSPLEKIFEDANLPHNGGLDLAVGEKKESIILHGGTTVQGVWKLGLEDPQQRSCTLSFPVKNAAGRIGFLTSYACSSDDFFVQDANGNSIQVGLVLPPRNFALSDGLDYRFVLADDNYWSETDSKSIMSSEYLHDNMIDLLLPMTIPTQPPFTGVDVCVFGGFNKKMVCGEILEFDVTIQVPVPGTKGKESVDFAKVVKVEMTDDYDLGYMGAPVYIPGQIPFTSQFIAHPVGQIVETLEQYKQEVVQEPNIWYYIPIDRILKDSDLELFLGNFSGNGNEQVLMGGKNSSSNLEKRQNPALLVGNVINFRRQTAYNTMVRTCTLGFAVKRIGGRGSFPHGYLTAGSCSSDRLMSNPDSAFVVDNNAKEIIVGTRKTRAGSRSYDPENGLDYALISVDPDYWNPQGSMSMYAGGDGLVPVISPVSPAQGTQVCFVGGYSGLVCGQIRYLDKTVTRTSPWRDLQGQYPEEYFQHMVWVLMDVHTRAQMDGRKDLDRGAAVFVPVWSPIQPPNQPKQLIGTQPVGIFAEYTTHVYEFNIPFIGTTTIYDTFYFAYTPLERILAKSNLELIQTPHH